MPVGGGLFWFLNQSSDKSSFTYDVLYNHSVRKFTTSKNPAQFIKDLSVAFANKVLAMTYDDAYWYLKHDGFDLANYKLPVKTDTTSTENRLFTVDGKKTRFENQAEINALLAKTPKYSKWFPNELLPFAATVYDPFSYKNTYNKLFSLGVDLSAYVNPNDVQQQPSQPNTALNIDLDYQKIGSFFIIIIGFFILKRILR